MWKTPTTAWLNNIWFASDQHPSKMLEKARLIPARFFHLNAFAAAITSLQIWSSAEGSEDKSSLKSFSSVASLPPALMETFFAVPEPSGECSAMKDHPDSDLFSFILPNLISVWICQRHQSLEPLSHLFPLNTEDCGVQSVVGECDTSCVGRCPYSSPPFKSPIQELSKFD